MADHDELLHTGFDPSRRELCPDGACIGVLGPDGRCPECGKVSPAGPPAAGDDAPGASARRPRPSDAPVPTVAITTAPRAVEDDDFDPDRRKLCPDGACIGVLGPDGRCPECGKRSPHGPRTTAAAAPSARDADVGSRDDESEGEARIGSDDPDDAEDPDEFDARKLCPDGACIGVIGPDGRCPECGARAD